MVSYCFRLPGIQVDVGKDTLRTHIRGVLSRHPDWAKDMSAFEAEAAWIIGDWDTVQAVSERGHAMASVMLDLHRKVDISHSVSLARRAIGEKITSQHYPRAYDSLMQLHILRDVELMESTRSDYLPLHNVLNGNALQNELKRELLRSLDQRLNRSAPAFRHRETILSVRRTGLGSLGIPAFTAEVGQAWIASAKIARKAGYEQTAYSSVLQAKELDTPFAFIQQVKLLVMQGGPTLASRALKHSLAPMVLGVSKEPGPGPIKVGDAAGVPYDKHDARFERDHKLAKVRADAFRCWKSTDGQGSLLLARWLHDAARGTPNETIAWFGRAINLSPKWVPTNRYGSSVALTRLIVTSPATTTWDITMTSCTTRPCSRSRTRRTRRSRKRSAIAPSSCIRNRKLLRAFRPMQSAG